MKEINIGILGFGNVGGGTYKILEDNKPLITKRTNHNIIVKKVLVSNINKDRAFKINKELLTTNPDDIINNGDIDIVVEAMGGIEPATEYMIKAMNNKKNIVTANKAAVASNYESLNETAANNGVLLLTEACVAGAIPALSSIKTSLQGNRFYEVSGILNGTTNYILSKMYNEGRKYEDVLKEAQEKGFAEMDPTDDVMGIDVANKLSILISLVFEKYVHPKNISTKGINNITIDDILKAKNDNKKIKLIGSATLSESNELTYKVEPIMITSDNPLYNVDDEFNAVYVKGDAFGELMYYGKGAGPLPTGSAVVGDIISIVKNGGKNDTF
ncbi:MAG TPA: homoserine dehydrogenase [Anaerovoracaceae bacterium]|nr:homoserine dehydrogenase [Anaerovoracaceae bacterium]